MGFFVKRACSHRSIGGTGDQYTPNRTLELRQRAYELNRTVYSARFQCERGAVRPSSLNLRLAYPQPSQQRPGCGFPVMQVVACFCLHTGALLHWASSQLQRHESPLLRSLLPLMEKGSIVLTDRGYCSYSNLALCVEHQLDAVMRLHQARKVDMRCGKKLGKLDRLAEWKRPQRPKKGWSKDEWRQLPNTLAIRVVRLKIQNRGFRPHQLWIATTLTDAKLYPKEALVELYRRRWQAELFLRDMKTTMGMEQLRCKSPSMVQKEFVMFAIAYNLLRLLMADAALLSSQQPYQLSFKGAADTLRHYKKHLVVGAQASQKTKKGAKRIALDNR